MWPILFWMKSWERCANHTQETFCLNTAHSSVRHYCLTTTKRISAQRFACLLKVFTPHSAIQDVLQINLHPSCTSCWIYMQFRRRQNIFKVAVLPTPFSFRADHSPKLIVQRHMFICNGCFCACNTSLTLVLRVIETSCMADADTLNKQCLLL